jgi:hypothetical protein
MNHNADFKLNILLFNIYIYIYIYSHVLKWKAFAGRSENLLVFEIEFL